MIPIKIDFINSKNGEFNITILGVGHKGYNAVHNYPCSIARENRWLIKSLTICDDKSEGLHDIIKNTDVLFLVGAVHDNDDDLAVFAGTHLYEAKNREATVLINLCGTSEESEHGGLFTTIISCDSADKVYRIVEMLFVDMHDGYVSIDYSDINRLIQSADSPKFCEVSSANEVQIKEYLIAACKEIRDGNQGELIINMMLYAVVPKYNDLTDFCTAVLEILSDFDLDRELIIQIASHSNDMEDTFTVSMIYGAANTALKREKSQEGVAFIDP